MRKFFYLMAMVIIAMAFSACTDDSFLAEVTLPAEATGNKMVVDAYAHDFTFDIKTEGQWKVESDSRFLHVSPNEGTGNATVTVSVQNNQSDERKEGNLTIIFPGHEEENKTITIEQKYAGDYGENAADIIETSNKIYAVGYSYDCTGEYASPNSVKMEVFDARAMMKDDVLAVNTVQASLAYNTITGSSISEMTNHLTVKANVNGGFGKFKAEANASFDMDHVKNSNYEFASTYFDLEVRHASLSKDLETLKFDYMTDDAWNAINGIPVTKRGVTKVAYPSTPEGFKRLFEQYGTHVIVECGLGGRVRYSMSVDISDINSSYDIKAFAKASYAGVVTAEGSVDEKFSTSFKNHKENLNIKLYALGGDEALAKQLGSKEGFTKTNLDAWVKSVTKDNMALISFGTRSLVPIYELVERNATEKEGGFNGEDRYNAMKEYFEKGSSADFSSYDCGTVTEFVVPSFDNAAYNSSLIKDIVIDGQYVGQVCNEYIPNIDREHRVTVVYPIINNKARYNMGFFLGNNSHKPARVSWEGSDVRLEEYVNLDFGKVDTLYLRGASITATPPDGTKAFSATAVKDEFLEGLRYNSNSRKNELGNYPLVKIFDKIWTRENYNYRHNGNYGKEFTQTRDGKQVTFWSEFYTPYNCGKHQAPGWLPAGWRVSTLNDFKEMNKKLTNNGFSYPGLALKNGGVTGFELYYLGKYDTWGGGFRETYNAIYHTYDGKQAIYESNGSFDDWGADEDEYCPIRLVKN